MAHGRGAALRAAIEGGLTLNAMVGSHQPEAERWEIAELLRAEEARANAEREAYDAGRKARAASDKSVKNHLRYVYKCKLSAARAAQHRVQGLIHGLRASWERTLVKADLAYRTCKVHRCVILEERYDLSPKTGYACPTGLHPLRQSEVAIFLTKQIHGGLKGKPEYDGEGEPT